VHWITAADGIGIEELIVEAGQRRQFAPLCRSGQAPLLQLRALGQDVPAGHGLKLGRFVYADKAAEVRNVALVGTARLRIVDIGKPLGRDWHGVQLLEMRLTEPVLRGLNHRRAFVHAPLPCPCSPLMADKTNGNEFYSWCSAALRAAFQQIVSEDVHAWFRTEAKPGVLKRSFSAT
jgi:hypothetical protein